MKVICISDNGHRHRKITINIWPQLLLPILLLVAGLSFAISYSNSSLSQVSLSKKDIKPHQNFSQILNKLSVLDADVQRLNTLGAHIASRSKLDIKNFDLSNVPARGGVVDNNYFGTSIVLRDSINNSVKNIERDVEKQKLKLRNLVASLEIKEVEDYLAKLSSNKPKLTKVAKKRKKSRGRRITYDFSPPMVKGYISSPFGVRKDPINGSLRHHGGLDIAAKKGTNVYAIANGFVSFSGRRSAYGNLLEISHSEKLKSRYAHLDSYLVRKGQLVKKGQLIGKVGATGRVTGPHLHLEISENDKIIDPKVYLKGAMSNL